MSVSDLKSGDIVTLPTEPQWYLSLGPKMRSVVRLVYRLAGKSLISDREWVIR
jgi:hypothetical protein